MPAEIGYGRAIKKRWTGHGMIQPGAHPEYDMPEPPPSKNPRSSAARMLRQPQEIKESYDDMIAKARGQRAYYQGSPSKTKGALAARMAGR